MVLFQEMTTESQIVKYHDIDHSLFSTYLMFREANHHSDFIVSLSFMCLYNDSIAKSP